MRINVRAFLISAQPHDTDARAAEPWGRAEPDTGLWLKPAEGFPYILCSFYNWLK